MRRVPARRLHGLPPSKSEFRAQQRKHRRRGEPCIAQQPWEQRHRCGADPGQPPAQIDACTSHHQRPCQRRWHGKRDRTRLAADHRSHAKPERHAARPSRAQRDGGHRECHAQQHAGFAVGQRSRHDHPRRGQQRHAGAAARPVVHALRAQRLGQRARGHQQHARMQQLARDRRIARIAAQGHQVHEGAFDEVGEPGVRHMFERSHGARLHPFARHLQVVAERVIATEFGAPQKPGGHHGRGQQRAACDADRNRAPCGQRGHAHGQRPARQQPPPGRQREEWHNQTARKQAHRSAPLVDDQQRRHARGDRGGNATNVHPPTKP